MAKIITQHRRGTTAEWEAAGVIPMSGEIIIVLDNDGVRKLKIGDGTTAFTALPFITDNLSAAVTSLNAQLQQLIAGSDPIDGSWEAEVENIRIDANGYKHQSAGDAVRQTQMDLVALESSLKEFINAKNVDGLEYTSNYELYLTSNGTRVSEPVTIVGGKGTGNGSAGSTVTFENLTTDDSGQITNTINTTAGNDVILTFKFTSVDESNLSTGLCNCDVKVNSELRERIKNVPNGSPYSIDVTKYINAGSNIVELILTDMYGASRSPRFSVEMVNLSISSDYNVFSVKDSDFDFYYKITGKIKKKVVFKIDDTEYSQLEQYFSNQVNNAEQKQTIPVSLLTSGIHKLKVQAFGVEDDIKSLPLELDLMVDKGDNIPMIASKCDVTSLSQGNPLSIRYMLYNPSAASNESTVSLEIYTDETRTTLYSKAEAQVTRSVVTPWPTRDYPAGETVCFRVAYYDTETNTLAAFSDTIINVQKNDVSVTPEPDPIIYLSSRNKNNNQKDRDSWTYSNKVSNITTTFENLNWVSNGWVKDTSDNIALRLNGNAKAIVNYEPFYQLNTALADHGLTFEVDFAVRDLNDRYCTLISVGEETAKVNTQVDEYTYSLEESSYVIKDSSGEETEAIILEHSEGGWVYREGVNGVPKPLPETNSEITDSNGLGGTYIIDDITTLTISPKELGAAEGTITVQQTTTVNQLIGIKMTPDTATLGTNLRSISCKYKDEERIRVSFTIDSNTSSSSKLICCYIDGVLSGVTNYTDSDNFNNNMKIVLGSEEKCTLDVYCIRVYDKALSAAKILDNYIYDHSDINVQNEVYLDNLIYTDDVLTYDKVAAKMPAIIFTGKMPTYKGDKRIVKMDFVNPHAPERNFRAVYGNNDPSFIGIDVEIDVQGTSSQYYVRKNWKVKLKKKKTQPDGSVVTLFDHEAYNHMEDEIPAKVFCIKVDYAEGTGTHNTQNANFAETLYDEKVPAQYDDERVRTTVAGFPCAIFERETETSPLVFSSKGNFNFDKDAEDAFGFTSDYDVECWEFCNNVHATSKFLTDIDEHKWGDNFEARCFYPKYIDYEELGYSSLEDLQDNIMDDIEALQKIADSDTAVLTSAQSERLDTLRAGSIARFKRMHDWVVSTKDDLDKFEREFHLHFNLHYSSIYYVYTFFALMTDQRAKNMFLTYWGRRVYKNATTGMWMIDDINTNIHSANQSAPVPVLHNDGIEYFENINGEDIVAGYWYPYLYDNDTSFGIDNSGNPVFDYYHEDSDTWDNGQKYVYNGQESVLWTNFRQKFANQIQQTYADLRKEKLTAEKLYHQFITDGSEHWNASIYNEDAEYKYISMARPGGNGKDPVTGQDNPPNTSNLYQVKGDGKHQFKYFVQNRIRYCDSKWHAGDYPKDVITLRFNEIADVEITPFSTMYCGIQFGTGATPLKTRTYANECAKFRYEGSEDINDLDISIFGAKELSSIGDLSKHNISRLELQASTKLTELKLGDSTIENNVLKSLDNMHYVPLMETLNITNCKGLASEINLSSCPLLKHVYALGSSVSAVTTSKGGYVKTLHLPTTITELCLQSQHDLKMATESDTEGLAIGSTTGVADGSSLNITKLAIHDCPDVDTDGIFSKCLASGKLERVYITGVKWEFNDWTKLRRYYTPKQSDVATDVNDTEQQNKPYYVKDHGNSIKTYVQRGYQGAADVDTGIPAVDAEGNPVYGYGLKGLEYSSTNGTFIESDKINVQGTCIIKQDISGKDMAELRNYFGSNLIFSTDEDHHIISTVYFRNDDNTETLVEKTVYGRDTSTSCPDLTADELKLFTKQPSIKYRYVFTEEQHGWSLNSDSQLDSNYVPNRKPNGAALSNVLGDRYLFPVFTCELRSYDVYFYNDDNSLIETQTLPFGSVAVCSIQPRSNVYDNHDLHPFAGWKIYSNNTTVNENDLIINESTIEYDETTQTHVVKVYAVYKSIDEQYEIPNELELDILIDESDTSKCHIKGRTDHWIDEPNVFVQITNPMTVSGSQREPISISGFNNFEELQLINLPDSIVSYISTERGINVVGTFEGCSNLAEFTISDDVKSIGARTFANCTKLSKIYFNAKNADDLEYEHKPFINAGKFVETDLYIGSDVEKIPAKLFYTSDLKAFKINKLVWAENSKCTTIKDESFDNVSITHSEVTNSPNSGENVFELPASITLIEKEAFYNAIRSENYPVTLMLTGKPLLKSHAFLNCNGLSKVYIPAECRIDGNPFASCSKLQEFDLQGSNYKFENGSLLTTYNRIIVSTEHSTIGKNVTSIGDSAFHGNTALTTLEIDSSYELQNIGSDAFTNCTSLTSVDLEDSNIESIGYSAFYKCSNLTTLKLPRNISAISSHSFYDCPISELVIPANVKLIDIGAFCWGTSLDKAYLTKVTFEDPNGWSIYSDSGNTPLYENVDLSDTALNAEYLTYVSSYSNKNGRGDYRWKKN